MNPSTTGNGATPVTQRVDCLVSEALMGDPRAARALYDLHVDRVYSVAFRILTDEEMARECTQLAFVQAFKRLETFRGESTFVTWLHRITVNVALSKRRQLQRTAAMELELKMDAPTADAPADPLLRERIEGALRSLPELYRVAVVLHDVEGFTHDDIGRILNIATGTSKARLFRARAKLRTLLAECAREYSFQ